MFPIVFFATRLLAVIVGVDAGERILRLVYTVHNTRVPFSGN